jgi:hypothetical protein
VVVVILEAPVPEDRWNDFQRAFHHAMKIRPKEVIASYLTHDTQDTNIWRIVTVWTSHQEAMALYNAGATMPSMHAFHLVGVIPVISISDILDHV